MTFYSETATFEKAKQYAIANGFSYIRSYTSVDGWVRWECRNDRKGVIEWENIARK